jgi:hypothetical protein
MKLPYILLTLLLAGCAGHHTANTSDSLSAGQIDIRDYFKFRLMHGSEITYCYHREGKNWQTYARNIFVSDTTLVSIRYNSSFQKVSEMKFHLLKDSIKGEEITKFNYSPMEEIDDKCTLDGQLPYVINLEANKFTQKIYSPLSKTELREDYSYIAVTDTTGLGQIPIDSCIKCIRHFEGTVGSFDGTARFTFTDLSIYVRGIGCIYFTESGGEDKYRLEKMVDSATFARMKNDAEYQLPRHPLPVSPAGQDK